MATTYLRVLRLKYRISLGELARKIGVSNQQFSRMENGAISFNAYQEEKAALAVSKVIDERKRNLMELEHDFLLHKENLLKAVEVEQDGA